jgi:multidrug efflux pump subunit AcrB
LTKKYIYSLKFLIKNKWVAVGGLELSRCSVFLIKKAPSGFIPTEDQGFVLYAVNTPPGSSLERTHKATEQIDKIINGEKATNHLWVADGLNFISNANASPILQVSLN